MFARAFGGSEEYVPRDGMWSASGGRDDSFDQSQGITPAVSVVALPPGI